MCAAWKMNQSLPGGEMSGVGKQSPEVLSGSLGIPVDSLVHAVAVDLNMLPLFIYHQILI